MHAAKDEAKRATGGSYAAGNSGTAIRDAMIFLGPVDQYLIAGHLGICISFISLPIVDNTRKLVSRDV